MTPDRPPTREETRTAFAAGLRAWQQGLSLAECPWSADAGTFEAVMRSAWAEGWIDRRSEPVTLD
jgi:hypothetical protein